MTPVQQQRLDRCIEFLRPIAQDAENTASEVYWIGARNADPDQGPSYCGDCGGKLVDKLNAENPDGEYLLDGGWGYESDGCEVCDKCGLHLRCSLSDCGVDQELDHWSASRIDLRGKHASTTAWFLLLTLECAYMGDLTDIPWLHGHEIDRAKRIQTSVHRLIRRIDAMRARRSIKKESI